MPHGGIPSGSHKPKRYFVLALALVTLLGCGGARGAPQLPSSSRTVVPTPHLTPPSSAAPNTPVASTGQYCPGLQAGHALVIAWIGSDVSKAVVRDVQNSPDGVTLCSTPPGAPRFLSASVVGIQQPGDFSTLDLVSGARSELLTYVHNDGPVVTWDWSPDQASFVYGRLAPDNRSIVFHLLSQGTDRVLSTIAGTQIGVGTGRAEFSPSGDLVALGAGIAQTGEPAAVQVRRLDGSIVFSSAGTSQFTWAGEQPRLYFQSTTGIQAWDPVNGAVTFPEKDWLRPVRSPDGRWLAYSTRNYPSETRVIDTRDGSDRSIARSISGPEWVSASVIRFDLVLTCPPPPTAPLEGNPCTSKSVVYDLKDGIQKDSALTHVFTTWPLSSPSWS